MNGLNHQLLSLSFLEIFQRGSFFLVVDKDSLKLYSNKDLINRNHPFLDGTQFLSILSIFSISPICSLERDITQLSEYFFLLFFVVLPSVDTSVPEVTMLKQNNGK